MPVSEVARNRVIMEMPAMPRSMMYNNTKKPTEVAYCRVSTEEASQEDSYERQISHYTDKISNNNTVEFGGIYADHGISGTHADTRPEFQKMMADARAGKIDIIRCKSLQRFGRNTVDILTAVRELKELGVGVIFEQQSINTLEMSGQILLTILAATSENESRVISENVKFGFKEKFRNGGVMVNWARFLGYRRNEDTKELEIIPEEAEIVRRIYREFLAGYSTHQIADKLARDNVKTVEWKKPSEKQLEKLKAKEEAWLALTLEEREKQPLYNWGAKTINSILTNEKYCGDSTQGKTYKVDVLSKKRLVNNGESTKFHNKNTHDGIISHETFGKVQEEMARRNGLRGSTKTGKAKFSSKYPLSHMLQCGVDGEMYRRFAYYSRNGESTRVWICKLKKVPKGDPKKCDQMWVKEQDIIDLYMEIVREIGLSDEFVETLKQNIGSNLDESLTTKIEDYEEESRNISKKLMEVMQSGLPMEQKQKEIMELMARQDEIKAQQQKVQEQLSTESIAKHRIEAIIQAIDDMRLGEEFDETVFKDTVEVIKIKDGIATFVFKCGIEIEKKIKQGAK